MKINKTQALAFILLFIWIILFTLLVSVQSKGQEVQLPTTVASGGYTTTIRDTGGSYMVTGTAPINPTIAPIQMPTAENPFIPLQGIGSRIVTPAVNDNAK